MFYGLQVAEVHDHGHSHDHHAHSHEEHGHSHEGHIVGDEDLPHHEHLYKVGEFGFV